MIFHSPPQKARLKMSSPSRVFGRKRADHPNIDRFRDFLCVVIFGMERLDHVNERLDIVHPDGIALDIVVGDICRGLECRSKSLQVAALYCNQILLDKRLDTPGIGRTVVRYVCEC